MTGTIYILQVGTDGPVKIGYTKSDVKRRVRAHQAGSPHILRWIGSYSGTRADELNAHRLLQNSALRGEWFYPTKEVLAFVHEKSPGFLPLVVENVLFKPHNGGPGSGRRPISIARPA
jgi:predicted GIY-YIG superfamily endonuclease